MELEIKEEMKDNLLYLFSKYITDFPDNKFRHGIEMLPQQEFISKLFVQSEYMKSLLLFWDTGMGKTLTVIYMIYLLFNKKVNWKVALFIKKQLQTDPWENNINKYIPDLKEYIDMFFYDSSNAIGAFDKYSKLNKNTNLFIIVDEAHNLISRSTSKDNEEEKRTRLLFNLIRNASIKDNNKIVLMTATPIINTLEEINTLSLLLRKHGLNITREDLNKNNIVNLKNYFNYSISYQFFSEENILKSQLGSEILPDKNVIEEALPVSLRQQNMIKAAIKKDYDNNMVGLKTYSKIYSTFAFDKFPEKGEDLKQLTEQTIRAIKALRPKMSELFIQTGEPANEQDKSVYNILYDYSAKFCFTIKEIKQNPGKCLVYITLVNSGGIPLFIEYLKLFNVSYIEYSSRNMKDRDVLINQFNSMDNINGDKIKTCVFSNAGNEGINFNSVNQLFLVDITWTNSSLRQIFGRSIRFKSHQFIDRKYVNVYVLKSVLTNGFSVEDQLMKTIEKKHNDISVLSKVFKEASFENSFNFTDYLDYNFIYNGYDKETSLFSEIYNTKFTHDKKSVITSSFKELSPILFKDYDGVIKSGYRDKDNVYIDSRFYARIKTTPAGIPMFYIKEDNIVFILDDE